MLGTGIYGVQRGIGHAWSVAHDPACVTPLAVTSKPANGAVCEVESGVIREAVLHTRIDHNGNLRATYSLDFEHDGRSEILHLGNEQSDLFDIAHRKPGSPAAAEWVDGTLEYVATADATLGPLEDATGDEIAGIFCLVLGTGIAFFAYTLFRIGATGTTRTA